MHPRAVAIAIMVIIFVSGVYVEIADPFGWFYNLNSSGSRFYTWLNDRIDELPRKTPGQIELDVLAPSELNTSLYDQCIIDERDFANIEQQLIKRWKLTWQVRSAKAFATLLTENGRFMPIDIRSEKLLRIKDEISETEFLFDSEMTDKKKFVDSFQSYLNRFKNIDFIYLNTKEYVIASKDRNLYAGFDKLQGKFGLEIRGVLRTGEKVVERGKVVANIKLIEGLWQIDSLTWADWLSTKSKRLPSFQKLTDQLQLSRIPFDLRSEKLGEPGYGLGLLDLNNDRKLDVIAGKKGKALIWHGDGKGGFNFENYPDLPQLDNLRQIVPLQIAKDKPFLLVVGGQTRKDLKLHILNWTEKKWQNINLAEKERLVLISEIDFDHDGWQDLLLGEVNSEIDTDINLMGQWWIKLKLWRRIGEKFEDITAQVFATNLDQLLATQTMTVDVDFDGWQDILIFNHLEVGSSYWLKNEEGKKFELIGKSTNNKETRNLTSGLSLLDIDQDGVFDLISSQGVLPSLSRLQKSCHNNWQLDTLLKTDMHLSSISLWQGSKNGKFSDVSKLANLLDYDYFSQGVNAFDYNNDGLTDLFVTTGSWSGESADTDLTSDFALYYFMNFSPRRSVTDPWYSAYDGFYRFLKEIKIKENIPGLPVQKVSPSFAGYQPNLLFRNNGDGTFTEVGYHEELDSKADGFISAIGDINNDGKVDLVLRNRDSTIDSYLQPAIEIYLNTYPDNHGISLKFINQEQTIISYALEGNINYQYLNRHYSNLQNSQEITLGLGKELYKGFTITWADQSQQYEMNLQGGRAYELSKRLTIGKKSK